MYKFVEVDGESYAEVLRNQNAQDPIFPPLRDEHFSLGYWWLLKEDHGTLCGFAGLTPMDPFVGVGYCKRAYVAPDHRGHNLHLKMLEARIAKARELGWHQLVAETTSTHAAHNFVLAGFEACEPEQVWGSAGSLYFVKHLTP
jgi:GNAT superfamily N-acetyltransferase